MNNIHKYRLLKLADYLDKALYIEPSFLSLGYVKEGKKVERDILDYGQGLTALEELFPETWVRNKHSTLVLANTNLGPMDSLLHFFDIDFWEYAHMFTPFLQNVDLYGGKYLSLEKGIITPQDISFNIRCLIKKYA